MIEPYKGKDIQPYYPTAIDIETAPSGAIIGIGFAYCDAYDNKRWYKAFETTKEWYDYYCKLIRRFSKDKEQTKRLTRIYAHNGANFDYLKFYEDFSELEELSDAQYFTSDSAGLGLKVTLKTALVTITFFDSYRLLPASLAKLTKTFNVDHIKQTIPDECKDNYLLFKQKYPLQFWSYLEADVLGLQEIVYLFWVRIYELFGNVGLLPMTLPSLVLRVFSKQLQEPIATPSNAKLKELERDAYKGGLTLCLQTGIFENVNVYDVNSMYPSVMVSNKYPCHYVGYWSDEYDSTEMGLWKADYVQSNQQLPPFLFDHETGASYSGSGVYTTNELNYLAEIGGTFTVSEGYVYVKSAPLFKDFISKVYALRQTATEQGDEGLAFTLKIMMNSLYGKFAQRETGDKIVLGNPQLFKELVDSETPFKIMGDFFVIRETREVQHAFVAIAAMITANARIDLHRRMKDVIDNGYDVYYCDTDSIHTNAEMLETSGLGGLKLENSGTAAYAGRKIYAFQDGKVKAKGIGRNITEGALSFETIARLATDKNESETLSFTRFPSVKGVLGKKEKAAVISTMSRKIRNTGGIWDED